MPFENDFIRSLVSHDAGQVDGLLQVAATYRNGKLACRVLVCPLDRIGAALSADGVFLKRRYGRMAHHEKRGVLLSWPLLSALMTALEDWEKQREDWWAFHFTTSGFPAGMGGAEYIVYPGKDGERKQVYRSVLGHREGEPLKGHDKTKLLHRPRLLGYGVRIVAEIYRVGEEVTPPEGLLSGVVYGLPDKHELRAERYGARLSASGKVLWLEPSDMEFVKQVLACREQDTNETGMA